MSTTSPAANTPVDVRAQLLVDDDEAAVVDLDAGSLEPDARARAARGRSLTMILSTTTDCSPASVSHVIGELARALDAGDARRRAAR